MDMISIIIPTLWICNTTENLLSSLIDVENIDEIIIIDNDSENRPSWPCLKNIKITLVDRNQNIFVNPAWNLGVKIAKNNSICLLNDDVIFDTKIFNLIDDKLLESVGLIGLDFHNNKGEIKLKNTKSYTYALGCCMFLHRNKYIQIPNNLKVMLGDTFLLSRLRKNNDLFLIEGSRVTDIVSVTCRNKNVISKYNLSKICKEERDWWDSNIHKK